MKTETQTTDRLLTARETCAKLGIGRTTLYLWGKKSGGDIGFPTPMRAGKQQLRFRESELDAWLESRRGV